MIKYKNIATNVPKISVHITYADHFPKTVLRGYAIQSANGYRIDGVKTIVRTASSPERIPFAEQYLVSAVLAALPRERSGPRSVKDMRETEPTNRMVKAFMALKENGIDIPGWNKGTKNRHMKYFERHILPYLKDYVDEGFGANDLDELRKTILDDILRSRKSRQIMATAETTANASLAGAAVIYARMREEDPDLPDIVLAAPRRYKRILPEQVKALPNHVRRRFFAELERLTDHEPRKVFASILMASGGLRTGEAAGTLPQQLLDEDGYITVPVLYQERQGKRTPILKTDNAYRLVPLPYWGSELIRRCCLKIEAIPDDQVLVTGKELSAWILRLLRKCGCDDMFIRSVQDAQAREPEVDGNGLASHDIAAYVLRRDQTDRWRSCCGLSCDPDSDSEIDYLLGHQTPHKRKKTNMRLPDQRRALAEKLERYIYSTKISRNPAIEPIGAVHGSDFDLTPFPYIRIRNTGDEPLNIHIDVEAMEGCEPISLVHPGGSLQKNITIRRINTGGTFVLNGAEFRFSINQQTSGKYLMRGRVSAISPEDGSVLQVVGSEKKQRLNRRSNVPSGSDTDIERADAPKTAGRQKILNITTEVYGQSLDEMTIKADVERAILRLYTKHADLIHRRLKTSSRPDLITPAISAVLYAMDYLSIDCRNTSDRTQKAYAKAIKDHYAMMPAIPMAQMTRSMMKQYLAAHAVNANTLRLLTGFWHYCLDKGICVGDAPFPTPQTRKLSVATKQAKAVMPDELSIKMQDKLYEHLINGETRGEACGIALMLWGGFSTKDICAFRWKDIIFDQERPDLVRVCYHQNDKAGATHDFTRPLFPQAARILRKRYGALTIQYTPKELETYPIASTSRSAKNAMTANALTQYGAMLLRTIGVSEEILAKLKIPKMAVSSRIFHNTYVKNLIQRCGLSSDPGTVQFMLGQSLSGSVTDDHYSSFVSELAVERIFTALKAAGPLESIEQLETMQILSDGRERYTATPEDTRQRVGIVADIVLQPGEELVIICPHGVSGSVRARAIDENGNKRRFVHRKET